MGRSLWTPLCQSLVCGGSTKLKCRIQIRLLYRQFAGDSPRGRSVSVTGNKSSSRSSPWDNIENWDFFQNGIGDLEGPCLYFDLDVIIVRSIDCFFEYMPGKFCVCREWLPPYKRLLNRLFNKAIGMNTSIFRFEANSMQFVIDRMNEAPQILKNIKLEQDWVTHVVGDQINWWPSEWVSSFKHRRPVYPFSFFWPPVLPRKTRVMVFNGPLKPSHAVKGNFELSPRRGMLFCTMGRTALD